MGEKPVSDRQVLEKLGYVVLLGLVSVGGNFATGKLLPTSADDGRAQAQIQRLETKIDLLTDQVNTLQQKLAESEKAHKVDIRDLGFDLEEVKRRVSKK